MPLLKDLRIPGSRRAKSFKRDDDEDDMILDAKARDKREKDFFEAKKKREEARRLVMERAKKLKEERQARERAAREQAAKEKKKSVGGSVGSGHRRNASGGHGNSSGAPRGIGGVAQGLKSAAQRDAEEKSYYESPIKDIQRSVQDDAGRYTDTGTGGYEAVADYAKDIAWREAQDEQVYEDRKTGMSSVSSNKVGGFSGGGSSSWGNESLTFPEKIINKLEEAQENKYRSNLYDIEDVVDEEYEDKYFGLPSSLIKKIAPKLGAGSEFSEEELDLAGSYPLAAYLGNQNKEKAKLMTNKIIEKYSLEDVSGTGIENAFKHAYLAALNRSSMGENKAEKFMNAHENKNDNLTKYKEETIMDLHNNAVGLSLARPLFMTDEEFADYVYEKVLEDGYWTSPEEHLPDWTN